MDVLAFLFVVFFIIGLIVLQQRGRRYRLESNSYRQKRYQSQTSTSQPFDEDSSRDFPKGIIIRGKARIVDGDTLVIRNTQIRLFGIDAPELDHPYGKKAKWALISLCKGQYVEAEVLAKDDHGRTVARCTLDEGADLSSEMVRQGLALDWPKYSGGEYRPFETPDARRKLWLADARQKGQMHVWRNFETRRNSE